MPIPRLWQARSGRAQWRQLAQRLPAKTVVTEVGPVELDVPRDRDGSFEPQIVRKRQRRLDGVDGIGMSVCSGWVGSARWR